jgi:serine/threonine protein phosphatase PrpC
VKGLFNKLFGQEKIDPETAPVKYTGQETAHAADVTPRGIIQPPQLISACAQSVGLQREHNEDALFALTTTLTSDHNNLPFGLYIVADGMGGHQHGEIASGIAIRAMASFIIEKLFVPILSVKPASPEESLQEIMQAGVQESHRTITKQVPGGGTTLTAVLILGEQITIAHVGDSRAYLVDSEGEMEALTRDHSLVRRLEELGQITHEEAAIHPQRNVLYRALGQGEPFDPDVKTIRLPEGGRLLICSDGLWGVVPEDEIKRVLTSDLAPEQACQVLIDAANSAGGPDNITAILIRLPG